MDCGVKPCIGNRYLYSEYMLSRTLESQVSCLMHILPLYLPCEPQNVVPVLTTTDLRHIKNIKEAHVTALKSSCTLIKFLFMYATVAGKWGSVHCTWYLSISHCILALCVEVECSCLHIKVGFPFNPRGAKLSWLPVVVDTLRTWGGKVYQFEEQLPLQGSFWSELLLELLRAV